MNPHEAAVKAALKTGDEMDRLIGRLGSAEHPRGEVLVAYRTANRGLAEELRNGRPGGVAEVLAELRRAVRATAVTTLALASTIGIAQGHAQAAVNGIGVQDIPPALLATQAPSTLPALNAWLASVEGQTQAAQALIASGADPSEILGDAERAGVLRPAPVIAEGSRWLASVVSAAAVGVVTWLLGRAGREPEEWYHQAVAALDERTTDCCLQVHGQVQPLSKPFQLTGTPRFSSEQMSPPFHWNCRSAEALIPRSQVGDDLTAEMREAARAELGARGPDGKNRVEIHPAHARSRR
jgi:hypothetical protein